VNLIERWFKELTDQRLRRKVFTNVPELFDAITTWGSPWNDDPKPFIWHTSADEIIEKVQRGPATLNRQINSTTEHSLGQDCFTRRSPSWCMPPAIPCPLQQETEGRRKDKPSPVLAVNRHVTSGQVTLLQMN